MKTPQVAAIPGMTPLGITPVKQFAEIPTLKEDKVYIVYHTDSTHEVARFKTQYWANRKMAKLGAGYSVTDYVDYNANVVKKIKVKNLMTGKEIEIDSNTPNYCNPASESYWSM
jgi:hypothetical protein